MKKRLFTVITILTLAMLSACGMSKDNQALAEAKREELRSARKAAEELYSQLTVDTFGDALYNFEQKEEEYEALEFKKVKNKDTEGVLMGMDSLIYDYQYLCGEMEKELKVEQDLSEDIAKYHDVLCYIENKSGSELSSMVVKDSAGGDSGNLLFDGMTLPSGRIIAGITITLYEGNTYTLVTTDTLGNENTYELSFEKEMADMEENGISIIINAPENGALVSDYIYSE